MVRKVVRRLDCKYYVERSLEKLGYKVNDTLQEKYEPYECAVTYESCNFHVETTESYWGDVGLRITINIDENNDIPYRVVEILDTVTRDVERSKADWCTGFKFLTPILYEYGQTHRVDLPAVFCMEINWVS